MTTPTATSPLASPPDAVAARADAPAALDIRAVSYSYPGTTRPALEAINLRLEPGTRLGILGPNGGGKTTLLRLVLGLLKPQTGEIRVFGRTPREARRESLIGYVPQRAEIEAGFPLSVRQVVTLGATHAASAWRPLKPAQRDAVEKAIDLVDAREFADRPIGKLSGGQTQRVLIARALAASPRMLLLDEPTVGIDIAGQRRFAELLGRIHTNLGLTVVVVSHSVRTMATGCDMVACLRGRLHSHTAPAGLTPQLLAELFSHDVEGLFGGADVVVATPTGQQGHAHVHGEACDHGHEHHNAHDHCQPPTTP
ncbi:MAG: metal ABC transporter ATP-binding protein [Phycisphaerales bacterium]